MGKQRIDFKPQFVEQIIYGNKTTTFRKPRKRPIKPGDILNLYEALNRFKPVLIATAECVSVIAFDIYPVSGTIKPAMPHQRLGYEEIAIKDGFAGSPEFFAFFRETYPKEKEIRVDRIEFKTRWTADFSGYNDRVKKHYSPRGRACRVEMEDGTFSEHDSLALGSLATGVGRNIFNHQVGKLGDERHHLVIAAGIRLIAYADK